MPGFVYFIRWRCQGKLSAGSGGVRVRHLFEGMDPQFCGSKCGDTLHCARGRTGKQVVVRLRSVLTEFALMSVCSGLLAQVGENRKVQPPQIPTSESASDLPNRERDPQAEEELQKGTALTRAGSFAEAIPHLRAAEGRVSNKYAARFNLSLCLVATGQPKQAIPILTTLRSAGHDVDVNNLLAQAYVGDGQNQQALEALQRASKLAPENERLYLYVAD